jgi:hypothetical protein
VSNSSTPAVLLTGWLSNSRKLYKSSTGAPDINLQLGLIATELRASAVTQLLCRLTTINRVDNSRAREMLSKKFEIVADVEILAVLEYSRI